MRHRVQRVYKIIVWIVFVSGFLVFLPLFMGVSTELVTGEKIKSPPQWLGWMFVVGIVVLILSILLGCLFTWLKEE